MRRLFKTVFIVPALFGMLSADLPREFDAYAQSGSSMESTYLSADYVRQRFEENFKKDGIKEYRIEENLVYKDKFFKIAVLNSTLDIVAGYADGLKSNGYFSIDLRVPTGLSRAQYTDSLYHSFLRVCNRSAHVRQNPATKADKRVGASYKEPIQKARNTPSSISTPSPVPRSQPTRTLYSTPNPPTPTLSPTPQPIKIVPTPIPQQSPLSNIRNRTIRVISALESPGSSLIKSTPIPYKKTITDPTPRIAQKKEREVALTDIQTTLVDPKKRPAYKKYQSLFHDKETSDGISFTYPSSNQIEQIKYMESYLDALWVQGTIKHYFVNTKMELPGYGFVGFPDYAFSVVAGKKGNKKIWRNVIIEVPGGRDKPGEIKSFEEICKYPTSLFINLDDMSNWRKIFYDNNILPQK